MNTKLIYALLIGGIFSLTLLSCDSDDEKRECKNFTHADSTCFCKANPNDANCVTPPEKFTVSLFTEEKADLTPHPSNGTIWTKGFIIDESIYLIDRESESPHAFYKFDIEANDTWEERADFPGTGYGLTGSANGKGYASSYSSNKFWRYDPVSNEWSNAGLDDLPFSPGETHWVEYKGKYYVPDHTGIYEFNATTEKWTKFSDQTSSGFGALFLIGDDMYWWNVNDDEMNHLNMLTKAYKKVVLPEGFNGNVTFHSPFVMGTIAYVVNSNSLWVFNNATQTWAIREDAIENGSAYVDDVFVIDNTAYLMDNGNIKTFEGVED